MNQVQKNLDFWGLLIDWGMQVHKFAEVQADNCLLLLDFWRALTDYLEQEFLESQGEQILDSLTLMS